MTKQYLSIWPQNSSGGISVETLQQVANDKGVDGLNALLPSFTCKKIATVLYPKLRK